MTTLHIINSAKTIPELTTLSRYFVKGDSVIFIQDGCYNLLHHTLPQSFSYYGIKDDSAARNIVCPAAKLIDYEHFIDLTLAHAKTISW